MAIFAQVIDSKRLEFISRCDKLDKQDNHTCDNHDKLAKHMPKPEIRPIFVRFTEAERRRIRTLAVSQGLTMREAILQAFEAWPSQLRSGGLTAGLKRSASSVTATETSRASAGTRSKRRSQPDRTSM